MKTPGGKSPAPSGTRRFLIHLSCAHDETTGDCRYRLRIQPWTPRIGKRRPQAHEVLFEDEYELIRAVNPILPDGSDVRNVLSHIESPEGFLYLLHLNPQQAGTLGWRG